MKIIVIGAGFAGIASARILTQAGHDVTVYEKAPDVGGVWSRTRRYPGLRTQNNKGTYFLSDLTMPSHYPEWPSGQQVQEYLADYTRTFDLDKDIRLSHEVVSAEPGEEGGWSLTVKDVESGETHEDMCDHLVVANGIFSEPKVPSYPGREEFEAAGGVVISTCRFNDLETARDKNVLVVGYGKSSCDVAAAAGEVAGHTTVVARDLLWKMPRKIGGILNFKHCMLTRFGEGLFPWIELRGFEKFLHTTGRPLRNTALGTLQSISTRQLHLKELGLVPDGGFERIARSTVSLSTDKLYDQVRAGTSEVVRDTVITRLLAEDGAPMAELSDGRTVPADLVICGTGFTQQVPFFSSEVEDRLTDDRGNFMLWRQVLPLEVPDLTFCGYNSSFYSPLSAEVAALWTAEYLAGRIDLPPLQERRERIARKVAWMEERTEGRHARGTNIIPFSMHNVDEMICDIGIDVPRAQRVRQWITTIDARPYYDVRRKALARSGISI